MYHIKVKNIKITYYCDIYIRKLKFFKLKIINLFKVVFKKDSIESSNYDDNDLIDTNLYQNYKKIKKIKLQN